MGKCIRMPFQDDILKIKEGLSESVLKKYCHLNGGDGGWVLGIIKSKY